MKSRFLILIALVALVFAGYFMFGKRPAASAPSPDYAASPTNTAAPPALGDNPPAAAYSAATATGDASSSATNEPPSAPVSRDELQRLMANAEKAIPSRSQLRKLTNEEVHETPAAIQTAGRELGRVAEAVSRDPSLAADAFSFYEKCATNGDYPSSVRALCYSDYERIGNSLRLPVNQDAVPASVRELAEKVKGL